MVKVNIISLGCPRNQIDSEIIAGSLKKDGFSIVESAEGANICVINTCAFVQSAREESIEKVLEAAQLKKEGRIKHLVVCGCLPQLYKEKLATELVKADLIVGTSDFPQLPVLLKTIDKPKIRSIVSWNPDYLYDEKSSRVTFTPPHYTYLKISEGCSNFCSYCIISRLRGAFRSRSIKSVIAEVKSLAQSGHLKEINIIGQDTTLFGIDRYGKMMLSSLLREVCALKNSVKWIRVLYTHPAHYSDELISTMHDEEKVCKYLDLPIQHISDSILKKMDRHVTRKDIVSLIKKLRKNIPGLVLRTSIIVGFPGETEKDFKELLEFLRDTRFEHLGAFIYSKEEGTRASKLGGHIPQKIKQERFDKLMTEQRTISSDINRRHLNKTIEVLIDEKLNGEKEKFLGRTRLNAPEIDGVVYVSGKNIKIGEFCKVKINDTLEYDIVGNKI